MLVQFEVTFYNCEGEYIDHDFQVDFQDDFQAIDYIIDWIKGYLNKHEFYRLEFCKVTKEDTSIIYPTPARVTLMCIEANV